MSDEQIIEALATKVMGLHAVTMVPAYRDPECGDWTLWCAEDGEEMDEFSKGMYTEQVLSHKPMADSIWREAVPDYLTDPRASKHLREKLYQLGWLWNLGVIGYESPLFMFTVANVSSKDQISVTSNSEERAAALAALKTVGVTPTPSPQ